MIRLTKLNQTPFYLNSDLVEFIEVTPDTMITTTNGGKLLVAEPAEEVVRRIIEYQRRIHACVGPDFDVVRSKVRQMPDSEDPDLTDPPLPLERDGDE